MTSDVVTSERLTFSYGKRKVLKDLGLRVPSGVTALLGPNGAGKTTLLHLLCGLRAPEHDARLTVAGIDVTAPRARPALAAATGFLPQTFGYLPNYTVDEFVAYAAWLKKVDRDSAPRQVETAIEAVDLTDVAHQKLRALSGGMRRRVGIATAIVHEPALVILDEPTVGLDPQQRANVRDLLRSMSSRSSLIISTHQTEDVAATCDTVIILERGRVLFQGTPAELQARAQTTDRVSAIEAGYLAVIEDGTAASRARR